MMSKFFYSLLIIVTSAACTSNYDDYNRDPGQPTGPEIEPYIRVLAFQQMIDNVYSSQENSYQMNENLIGDPYGRYLSIANSGFTSSFSIFNASASWINYPFEDVLTKFNGAWIKIRTIIPEDVVSLRGWSDILRVAAMYRVADLYGPIPYSKVGSGNINAPYDSVEDLYKNMIADLDKAIVDLTDYITKNPKDYIVLSQADGVYGGDLKKWVVFANSLKLRLAMRTVYADPTYAQMKAEEATNHSLGLITDNSQMPAYIFSSGNNPVYKMSVEWGDSMPAADIITYMVGYDDPRLSKYFKPATLEGAEGEYIGVRTGVTLDAKTVMGKYSGVTFTASDPSIWMTAAEVSFLRAEGAARNWNMGGTAQYFYEQGVKLSFDQWKATGVDQYLSDDTKTQANYINPVHASQSINAMSSITIKWNEGASFEEKLERIITQKWIAMYPLGSEAWSEQRRTGYPKFFPVMLNGSDDASLTTHLASRIPFPPSENDRNKVNLDAAIKMLGTGGDNYGTRLWWDAKPNKWEYLN